MFKKPMVIFRDLGQATNISYNNLIIMQHKNIPYKSLLISQAGRGMKNGYGQAPLSTEYV